MSDQSLRFLFSIDSIRARPDAPPQTFTNGHYKPPVQHDCYTQTSSTGWCQWTMNGVSQVTAPPIPLPVSYATSIFYDDINTKRFLFHPKDCRTVDISAIEQGPAHERWGWQGLCFTEKAPNHSVLDHDGEFDSVCGRGGSYIPHFLPQCYQSLENVSPCGLSGKMSLLLALTAFSCAPERMMQAIRRRLNIRQRRWESHSNLDWGNGRKVPFSPIIVRTDYFDRTPWPRPGCTHHGG